MVVITLFQTFIFLLACVYTTTIVSGMPGLLGVSRQGKGGVDLSDSTFKMLNNIPGQPFTRLVGDGLSLALNNLEIATSRGLLNITMNGYEFRRGRATWLTTQLEDRFEIRRNDEVLLAVSASDRLARPQFLFTGQSSFFDVVLDKAEGSKSIINYCLADRQLTSTGGSGSKVDYNYCKDSTASVQLSVTQQLEYISKILVAVTEQQLKLSSASTSQEKAIDTALTEKINPTLTKLNDVERRVSTEMDKFRQSTTTQLDLVKRQLQDELHLSKGQLTDFTKKAQDIEKDIIKKTEGVSVLIDQSLSVCNAKLDELTNNVSSSIAKTNSIFAKVVNELNHTLSHRMTVSLSELERVTNEQTLSLQRSTDPRLQSLSLTVEKDLTQSLAAVNKSLADSLHRVSVATAQGLKDVQEHANRDVSAVNSTLYAVETVLNRKHESLSSDLLQFKTDNKAEVARMQDAHEAVKAALERETETRKREGETQASERERHRSSVEASVEGLRAEHKAKAESIAAELTHVRSGEGGLASLHAEDVRLSERLSVQERALALQDSRVAHTDAALSTVQSDLSDTTARTHRLETEVALVSASATSTASALTVVQASVRSAIEQDLPSLRSDVTVLQRTVADAAQTDTAMRQSLDSLRESVIELRVNSSATAIALGRETSERTAEVAKVRELLRESTGTLQQQQTKHFESLSQSVDTLKAQGLTHGASITSLTESVRAHDQSLQDAQRQLLDARETASEAKALRALVEGLALRLTALERENGELKAKVEAERKVSEKEIERLTDALTDQRKDVSALRQENVELRVKSVDREAFSLLQKEVRDTQSTILTQATSLFKIVTDQYQQPGNRQSSSTGGVNVRTSKSDL